VFNLVHPLPSLDDNTLITATERRWRVTSTAKKVGAFVLTTLFFGTQFVGVRAAVGPVPPAFYAALRFDIGAVLLLVVVGLSDNRLVPQSRNDLYGIGAFGLFIVALENLLLFTGQQTVSAGFAAILFSFMAIFAPVYSYFLLANERLSPSGWLGVAVGLVGVIVVVDPNPSNLLGGDAVGQALVLGAAAATSLGSVLLKRAEHDSGSITVALWGMVLGAVLLHGVSPLLGEPTGSIAWTGSRLTAVLYVGIFSTGLGYPCYLWLIDTIGPVRTNLLTYLNPVVAAVVGWLVLSEQVTPTTLVGFTIIVLGFLLIEWRTLTRSFDLRSLGWDSRGPTGPPSSENQDD
jgi:drug/metabolite transporter (DMT)-like permease